MTEIKIDCNGGPINVIYVTVTFNPTIPDEPSNRKADDPV